LGGPLLDQLRGALPYHDALRGTIITLGSFSKGCQDVALYPGAAPIGLINGEKLLDLLIENQIGIRLRPAELYEVDDTFFAPADESSEATTEDTEPGVSAPVE
jgi:restriction system protein